jgi:hypothetical protein
MSNADELALSLSQILMNQEALRQDLRVLSGRIDSLVEAITTEQDRSHILSTQDENAIALIGPEMRTTFGGRAFTCNEALHANDRLREVIEAAVGRQPGTTRRLGRLLSRCSKSARTSLRITRVGEHQGVALWVVDVG